MASIKSSATESFVRHFSSFLPVNLTTINLYHAQSSSRRRVDILRDFAELTDCSLPELLDICLARGASNFSKRHVSLYRQGTTLPLDELLPLTDIPVCPQCLQENGYGRQIWHFRSYTACHHHHVRLMKSCYCGASLSMLEQGFGSTCHACGASLLKQITASSEAEAAIALWLAGETVELLPQVSNSHRWGLILWFRLYIKPESDKFCALFLIYFSTWPEPLFKKLKGEYAKALEFSGMPPGEMTFQNVFGELLPLACRLPDSSLASNIVLRGIVRFLSDEVIERESSISELAINSIEAAILLNTTTEQVASLYEQGILQTKKQLKNSQIATLTSPIFRLADVLCCWLTSYQSDTSNRRYLVSRW